MKTSIKDLAKELAPDLIDIRRHLHAHPELSYKEFQTSRYIKEKLKEWNIPFQSIADTGVVGLIKGRHPEKKCIALRADMDALPIQEENDIPYKSIHEGIMHACGHDVHMTCLLGAAKILTQLTGQFDGTVKLLFQPGEERAPGGASLLIKEGALKNPPVESILGLHVMPELEVGKIGFCPGISMASADEIYITVSGRGGHAAYPHKAPDTILIASHIVVALQQVISRNKNPLSPSVLSICSFNGGHTTNVIPQEVKLIGTFRAMDEEWRYRAHELIRRTAISIGEGMGARVEIKMPPGYPSLKNDEQLYASVKKSAQVYMGEEHIKIIDKRMGGEDFAFYSQEIPACFYRLGVGNDQKGITSNVHTSRFNIDEKAIEIGMGLMAYLALSTLQGDKGLS